MVRFIVPLQSPKVSGNWEKVSRLCNLTLKSIVAQTNPNFEVVLVCNEPPLKYEDHPQIKVILTDLPAPMEEGQPRMKDKWKKVRIGLAYYLRSPDSYYVVVDADDRVNNQLVEFVLKVDYKPGWYFDKGLIYDWGFPWFYKRLRFDLICGTSSVVFCPTNLLPTGADDVAEQCFIVTYGHTRIKDYFDSRSKPLKPLPFYGSVYILNTGENDSGLFYLGVKSKREQIKRIFSIRLITNRLKRQFFLWDI
jgi:hypothetical protein